MHEATIGFFGLTATVELHQLDLSGRELFSDPHMRVLLL